MYIQTSTFKNFTLEFHPVRATPGHRVGWVTYVTGDGRDRPHLRVPFTGNTADSLLWMDRFSSAHAHIDFHCRIIFFSENKINYMQISIFIRLLHECTIRITGLSVRFEL